MGVAGGQCLADCGHQLAAGTARCGLNDIHATRILYLPYLRLAAFAGALADYFPKGRVMFGTNRVKLGGCALLLAQVHPLFAYAAVGFGAAAYSPVKYGIFPELFASAALVGANAWIEVLTVVSILLGVGLGSLLMAPGSAMPHLLAAPAANTTLLISMLYGIAVFARRCPVPLRALLCRLHPPGDCCANFACALRAMARPEKPGFIGRHQSVLGRIRDLAVPDSELGCTSVGLAAASACGSVR